MFLACICFEAGKIFKSASCFIQRLVHDCSARDVRDHIQHASKKEGVSVDQYWGMCKVVLDSLSIYIYICVYMIYHKHMEVDMQATTRERHKKRQQRTQKSGEKEEPNSKCVRKQRAAKTMRRIGEDEILYRYTVYRSASESPARSVGRHICNAYIYILIERQVRPGSLYIYIHTFMY